MEEEKKEVKETTMFIDAETKRKIAVVAKAFERSMAAQVRYWAIRDYSELERLKLLPAEQPQDNEAA